MLVPESGIFLFADSSLFWKSANVVSVGDFLFFFRRTFCGFSVLFFACAEDFSGISIFLLFVYPFFLFSFFDLHVFVLFKFSKQTCVLCAVEKRLFMTGWC